jgi:hypothetical protein
VIHKHPIPFLEEEEDDDDDDDDDDFWNGSH